VFKHIVIIGNSAAGIAAAEAVRSKNKEIKLTIITQEDYCGYYRYFLPEMLDNSIAEKDLIFKQKDFYQQSKINLILNRKVEKINVKRKQIFLQDKTKIDYDSVIITSGRTMKPPKGLKGANKNGVVSIDNIVQLKQIKKLIHCCQTVCILGANFAGSKIPVFLSKLGLDVKLFVSPDDFLSVILEQKGRDFFKEYSQRNGFELISPADVVEIFGDSDIKAVKLDSGKVIGCSMLIIDKYYQPNTKFICDTVLETQNGIVVDEFLRTNVVGLFAAGNVAYNKAEWNCFWPESFAQGTAAGLNALAYVSQDADFQQYKGFPGVMNFSFLGLPGCCIGEINTSDINGSEELVSINSDGFTYKRIILKDDFVQGVVGIGKGIDLEVFSELILKKIKVTEFKNNLLSENVSCLLYSNAIGL